MNLILYLIAFLEGFTTLSVEIMAIRNSISIIGSNAIATSIILGIILLALSYGYYRGWLYAARHEKSRIRKKIYINLLIASLFYTCVSFPFENRLLQYLLGWDIGYFAPICIGISVLFIVPVFLASQTIPLLSELIDDKRKAVIIGKLLFFSTIGSFMGSVVTSLVFFSYIGVEKSILVNGIILASLSLILLLTFARKEGSLTLKIANSVYLLILIFLLSLDISSLTAAPNQVYQHSSEYNDIKVLDTGTTRLFLMNGSHSSGLTVATGKSHFGYIQEITRIMDRERPKKVLIIWAAGCSLPQDIAGRDYVEKVDVCDIDGSLDTIAETYFLQEKLDPKIVFSKESARYFIYKKIRAGEKYDFIFLDAYNGRISIPSELLTKEFFDSVEKIRGDTLAMNIIMDRDRSSVFSSKLSDTLISTFGDIYISAMNKNATSSYDNFIAMNKDEKNYTKLDMTGVWIYMDNINTLEIDKYNLFYKNKTN